MIIEQGQQFFVVVLATLYCLPINDNDELTPSTGIAKVLRQLFQRPSPHLLVEFGELTPNCGLAAGPAGTCQVVECCRYPMGRLVQHDGARLVGDLGQPGRPFLSPSRQKTLEDKPSGSEAAEDESRHQSGRSRCHLDPAAGFDPALGHGMIGGGGFRADSLPILSLIHI